MDPRLAQALEEASRSETLRRHRELLALKAQKALVVSVDGGLLDITPDLILMVKLHRDLGRDLVLMARHNVPVRIDDPAAFLDRILDLHTRVMNDYYAEWNRTRGASNLQEVLG